MLASVSSGRPDWMKKGTATSPVMYPLRAVSSMLKNWSDCAFSAGEMAQAAPPAPALEKPEREPCDCDALIPPSGPRCP